MEPAGNRPAHAHLSPADSPHDDGQFGSLPSSYTHTEGIAMAAPLPLIGGPARFEAALHICGISLVCFIYVIATVFQFYFGSDMRYEMRRRNPESTLLLTPRDL